MGLDCGLSYRLDPDHTLSPDPGHTVQTRTPLPLFSEGGMDRPRDHLFPLATCPLSLGTLITPVEEQMGQQHLDTVPKPQSPPRLSGP